MLTVNTPDLTENVHHKVQWDAADRTESILMDKEKGRQKGVWFPPAAAEVRRDDAEGERVSGIT